MTARMYIQCAGSVSIDGQPVGRLDPAAYEMLADYVPPDAPGFEHGDSLMFELRLVQIQNTPISPAACQCHAMPCPDQERSEGENSGASLVTANWLACRETETGRFPCPGDGY